MCRYWTASIFLSDVIARYNYYQMAIKILFSLTIATIAILAAFTHFHDSNMQDQEFEMFKRTYGKSYKPEQESFRKHIYLKNKLSINDHNSNNQASYRMEINEFADLTQQEFRQMYLGLKASPSTTPIVVDSSMPKFERDIDWRAEGKVTRVKNQGMCASCWAFCTVGALESAYLIKGVSQEFSQQQLVDCSNTYGNLGCHGGELEYTYRYIKDKGLNSQSSYPYIAKDQNCKKTTGPFKMSGYSKAITCTGLYNALLKGPVSVAVDAIMWSFYKDGVFNQCGNQVNHGVLVVGATNDYWLIKNSWGVQWGNYGYIKLARGNTCSVCEYPYYPEL